LGFTKKLDKEKPKPEVKYSIDKHYKSKNVILIKTYIGYALKL